MRALILTIQAAQGQNLRESFVASGFEVQLENSALFALTLIERNRPDVIVSTEVLAEMSGVEFYGMVRSDKHLDLVPFLLLTNSSPRELTNLDQALPPATGPAEVVRTAYKLVLELTRRTYIAEPNNPVAKVGIQGQLGDMSLFELAQWLAKSGKTGRLRVDHMHEIGIWLFSKGQLVHAEYNNRNGEDAVLQLLLKAEGAREGHFHFEPLSEADFFLEPVTIKKTTDQLLLSLAVEMDRRQKVNWN